MTVKVIDVLALLSYRCPGTYHLAIEMAEKDKENPLFDAEAIFQMYSAIQIEITADKFKMMMGELGNIQNYKVVSESKDRIVIQTEDGEKFNFLINSGDEIVFEDKDSIIYLAKT